MAEILRDAHFYALALSIFIPLTLFVLAAYFMRIKKRKDKNDIGRRGNGV